MKIVSKYKRKEWRDREIDNIRNLRNARKSSGCEICGYNRCLDALDFHHLHNKKFEVNNRKVGYLKMMKEMSKCIVVCANCHREIHAGAIKEPIREEKLPLLDIMMGDYD